MIDEFAGFVQKRAWVIIIIILLITALFLIPLREIKISSSPKLFRPPFVQEPYEKLESMVDFPFLEIYVLSEDNESILSLEALKEQLRLIKFLHGNFNVKTISLTEIINSELKEKYNKSLVDVKSEDELNKALYNLFEESPDNFKKMAQGILSKNYSTSNFEDYAALQIFSRLIPFSSFFISNTVELPNTKFVPIYVLMKNKKLTKDELKQTASMIRRDVGKLNFNHFRTVYYSFYLIQYDIDQKLVSNTVWIAIMTLIVMASLIFTGFRRFYFVFIPLFIVIIAVIWTFGTAVLLDLKITALHTFIIALLIGIALDGPLHITKRFLEQRRKDNFNFSLKITLSSMLPALFLTFITTAAAFVAQIILPSPPALFSFALTIIIGVTYSFILVCLLWPALMVVRKHPPILTNNRRMIEKIINKVFNIGTKYFKVIIVILIVALLISIYNASKIETDVSGDMFVPEGIPSKEAMEVMYLYSPPYSPQFILIEGDVLKQEILPALDKLKENIQDNKFFERIDNKVKFESVNTLLRLFNASNTTDLKRTYDELYESTIIADPVTKQTFADKAKLVLHKKGSNYDTILARISIRNEKTTQIKQSYDELIKDIKQSGLDDIPGVKIEVTGKIFSNAQAELFVRKVQLISSVLMILFTFLILWLIYKKLILSLIVSTPILLGSVFSLGFMYFLNLPLTWLNAMVITIIIGLGVDYSIYFTQRYKEEIKDHNSKEAARISLKRTAEGNWLAASTTILGFVIISFSFLPMAKSFGILTALSITLTFLITIFLLPSLLMKFVKK